MKIYIFSDFPVRYVNVYQWVLLLDPVIPLRLPWDSSQEIDEEEAQFAATEEAEQATERALGEVRAVSETQDEEFSNCPIACS